MGLENTVPVIDLLLLNQLSYEAWNVKGMLYNVVLRSTVKQLIIYMKKFLDCDWLREMQFFGNRVQKKGNLVQKRGNKRGILIG